MRFVPLGAANRAEKNRVGLAAGSQGFGGQRLAAAVNGIAAEGHFVEIKLVSECGCAVNEQPRGRVRDFRTDSVARQDDDFLVDTAHVRFRGGRSGRARDLVRGNSVAGRGVDAWLFRGGNISAAHLMHDGQKVTIGDLLGLVGQRHRSTVAQTQFFIVRHEAEFEEMRAQRVAAGVFPKDEPPRRHAHFLRRNNFVGQRIF